MPKYKCIGCGQVHNDNDYSKEDGDIIITDECYKKRITDDDGIIYEEVDYKTYLASGNKHKIVKSLNSSYFVEIDTEVLNSEVNSHPSIKRNKIEARGDASLNQDPNVLLDEKGDNNGN